MPNVILAMFTGVIFLKHNLHELLFLHLAPENQSITLTNKTITWELRDSMKRIIWILLQCLHFQLNKGDNKIDAPSSNVFK